MTPPRKRRTREHVIADLSMNHVERVVLRCGYTAVRNTGADYGIDLFVRTFAADGSAEPGILKFQLKATDRLPLLADGGVVSFEVSTADLAVWAKEPVPVILIVYDAVADRSYWLDVQEWARSHAPDPADWRTKTVRVRIPVANRFGLRAMRAVRDRKNETLPPRSH